MSTFTRANTELAVDVAGAGQQHRAEAGGMTIALERWNAGLDTQLSKSSCDRQRVYTRYTSLSSVGRSSSKASKPGMLATSPARCANRCSRTSRRSAGTEIALILTTLMGGFLVGAHRARPTGSFAGGPDRTRPYWAAESSWRGGLLPDSGS